MLLGGALFCCYLCVICVFAIPSGSVPVADSGGVRGASNVFLCT